MPDYTDLKRRLYVLTGAARDPNIVADPLEDAAYKAIDAIAALEAERDALRADAAADIERKLRGLLRGQFSSLSIGLNDDHACNYVTAVEWPEYRDDEECRIEWASDEERERAISQNSVWTLQWYPNTPVGFNCIGASSLGAIIATLADQPVTSPQPAPHADKT